MKLKAIIEGGVKVANPGAVVGKVKALARTLQGKDKEKPKKETDEDFTSLFQNDPNSQHVQANTAPQRTA